MIVAAIIGPSEESGPSTRTFNGPKNAYPTRHAIDVYRPVIGGKPASSAYAIPCGTSKAVSPTPAPTSDRSHRALYDDRVVNPGTKPPFTGSRSLQTRRTPPRQHASLPSGQQLF